MANKFIVEIKDQEGSVSTHKKNTYVQAEKFAKMVMKGSLWEHLDFNSPLPINIWIYEIPEGGVGAQQMVRSWFLKSLNYKRGV